MSGRYDLPKLLMATPWIDGVCGTIEDIHVVRNKYPVTDSDSLCGPNPAMLSKVAVIAYANLTTVPKNEQLTSNVCKRANPYRIFPASVDNIRTSMENR